MVDNNIVTNRLIFDEWILGQPESDKNRRRIVRIGKQSRLIKSKQAIAYSKAFNLQCPVLSSLSEVKLALWVDAFYTSRRPDLNCIEFIKDLLQDKVYKNDRQVVCQGGTHNIDKENPRVRVRVQEIGCAQDETYVAGLDLVNVLGDILDF